MSECPNCERQKQRVELWRQEAYRLSEQQTKGERAMTEEDDDIQDYKKPWVNLSDSQLEAIYYEVVAEHRGVPMPHGQVLFGQAVQARLKELNT